MITKSKQDWSVGSTVKVGFLTLKVRFACRTPGDNKPDAYILTNLDGTKLYEFVPHNGLTQIDIAEAKAMMAAHARAEANAMLQAAGNHFARAHIDELFA